MKKIYRQPTLKIVTINLESRMMSGSPDSLGVNTSQTTTGALGKDNLGDDEGGFIW